MNGCVQGIEESGHSVGILVDKGVAFDKPTGGIGVGSLDMETHTVGDDITIDLFLHFKL